MKRLFGWSHGPRDVERDVRRELEFHEEERRRELGQGAPAEATNNTSSDRAAVEAQLRSLRHETLRARHRRGRLDDIRQDLRIAIRGLRRTPGFAIVALLTIALGIGANAAVFTVVDSVMLRPLPYPDAGRLVQLWSDHRVRSGRTAPEWLAPPDFEDWRDQNKTFASMATYQNWGPILTGSGDPEALSGLAVSGDFFRVLGVAPMLGRTITPADDIAGAEKVVVLSYAIWQRAFGGDRAVLNRQVQLNGGSFRVVGVMPAEFRAPTPAAINVFRPVQRPAGGGCGRGCIVLRAIGRLKPTATLTQAQADIGAIAGREARDYPATNAGVGAWLIDLHEQIAGPTGPALLALSGAVALVLLIALVNVAGLLLLRGAARQRELSVRVALGATRGRLVRQMMTESVLLASAGGLLGFALATAGARWLTVSVPPIVRQMQPIGVNATVVAFAIAVSAASALLIGFLPSLKLTGSDLMGLLRSGARLAGPRGGGTQQVLVAAQLAIAATLLVGAGLLIRSLTVMQSVDLGYRTEGVMLDAVTFPAARYPDGKGVLALNGILSQLRANPAVRAAEVTDQPPLAGGDQDMTAIAVGEPHQGAPSSLWYRVTSPGYLPLMHVRLVEGRYFTEQDRAGSAPVGIVNAEAVKKLWGGKSPIGRELAASESDTAPRVTVVGVVAADRQDGPNQPTKAELFLPLGQLPANGFSIVVEPAHGAPAAVAAIRASIHEADPLLPFNEPVTMEDTMSEVVALPRLYAVLLSAFAAAALALAIIGVYGVMAYAVAQRQREIGVRLALGASPGEIRGLVLRRGARLAAIGTAAGLLGAAALTRLLGSLLFGVSALDLRTFVAVPLVLAATAFLACLVPALRAMRIDPIRAIRQD